MDNKAQKRLMGMAQFHLAFIWESQSTPPSPAQIEDTVDRIQRAFPCLRVPGIDADQVKAAIGRMYQ